MFVFKGINRISENSVCANFRESQNANFAVTEFSEVASRGVYALCSGSEWEERTEHAEFSRWAGAKHQDRHDEGRARRHVVLGGRHRGAPDIPRRERRIVLGIMRTEAPLCTRRPHTEVRPFLMPYSAEHLE